MDLVGVGADEAGLHRIDRAVERLGAIEADVAVGLAHRRVEPVAEGAAASELVLEEARLALVHAHRGVGAGRQQRLRRVGALRIDRVADLVHGRIEALGRIGRVDPGGDADVAAGAGGGGMHREIEPARIPVVAEDAGHPARQRELAVRREGTGQHRGGAGRRGDPGAERGQAGPEPAEQHFEIRGGGAGLEVVEERVVAGPPIGREAVGLGALQGHHALERRQEARDRARGARRHPGGLRLDRRRGDIGRETARHLHRAAVEPRRFGEIDRAGRVLRPGRGDPVGDPRVGAMGVHRRSHRRRMLGALGGAFRRHLGLPVPVQDLGDLLQRRDAAQVLRELGISGDGVQSGLPPGEEPGL